MGFLFNPLDGNSYLAKMYQGFAGSWRFTLPYTVDPGSGAYIFMFYLALGHLSRLLNIPVLVMFHIARIFCAFTMLVALWRWLKIVLSNHKNLLIFAFALSLLGSGFGWLAALWGGFTPDFWVAEAYPFLSAYANPHFPLGLAIILAVLADIERSNNNVPRILLFFLGCVLAIVMQFGVVILAAIWGGLTIWHLIETHQLAWQRPLAFLSGSLGILVYQYLTIQSDPILAGWNAQNLTPAPAFPDFLLGFLPALCLAVPGAWVAWLERDKPGRRQLLLWVLLATTLIYLPFNLQRRFMVGLFVPVVTLAALGLAMLPIKRNIVQILMSLMMIISLLTNIIILWGGMSAIDKNDPALFISDAEMNALNWISEQAQAGDVVVAGPEMGLWLPTRSLVRVIYGHPFETIAADFEKQNLTAFYSGKMSREQAEEFLLNRNISWIYYGPREHKIGTPSLLDKLSIAYTNQEVIIYQIIEVQP
jgi:hypothetical protein